MTIIWTGMVAVSILCAAATGRGTEVAAAATQGAADAVELCISIMGMLCLWSGVMEVMRQSGLAQKLSRLLRPVLRRLFWQVAQEEEIMDHIAANVSANLLGLGNAATPLGIQAVKGMSQCKREGARDAMCMLIVCNTASIQLIPSTVAAIRAAQGSQTPFDILPCVWLVSILSVSVGILMCALLSRRWKGCG